MIFLQPPSVFSPELGRHMDLLLQFLTSFHKNELQIHLSS
jgi:hypothetical protein